MAKQISVRSKADRLSKMCLDYLIANFNSFAEKDKQKIAIAIGQKAMPNNHEHSGGMTLDGNINLTEKFGKHFNAINKRFNIGV